MSYFNQNQNQNQNFQGYQNQNQGYQNQNQGGRGGGRGGGRNGGRGGRNGGRNNGRGGGQGGYNQQGRGGRGGGGRGGGPVGEQPLHRICDHYARHAGGCQYGQSCNNTHIVTCVCTVRFPPSVTLLSLCSYNYDVYTNTILSSYALSIHIRCLV
jgi:hypothetical protein